MKLSISLVIILALCAPLAIASEPGNLMHTTSTVHVQMPGMPAMPPRSHTQTVCVAARHPDPRDMLRNSKQCQVTDYKRVGNTVSYHMQCTAPMAMTGDGKFTLLANDGLHGTVHMTANFDGQHMQSDMTFDASKVGSCDYTPPPAN